MPSEPVNEVTQYLQRATDLCVQCGLCLPHCPTYRYARSENESPRGRIQLMRAMAAGQLPVSGPLVSHIDRCLSCRRCESVCPAEVPYGRLLDSGRALITANRRSSPLARATWRYFGRALIDRPRRIDFMAWSAYFADITGLRRIARATGLLRLLKIARLERMMPATPRPRSWRTRYPATHPRKGSVQLFLGCVARVMDSAAIDAAISVLTRIGYDVVIPPQQNCCGALHLHGGDTDSARQAIAGNVTAFNENDDPIITLASGCGATLIEYGEIVTTPAARDFAKRVAEFSEFVAAQDWPLTGELKASVAVHEPCTLRNVMKTQSAAYRLLQRINGLSVVPLAGNDTCCGAAGTYFITQPEISDFLLNQKIAAITDSQPQYVVTSNIGCALHLRGGVDGMGNPPRVLHPAQLLAQSWDDAVVKDQ